MQPPFDIRRSPADTGGGKPPPDPIRIVGEIAEVALKRWVFAAILVAGLAWGTYALWPDPVVRAEMDYLTLQRTVIGGAVESITISEDEARGTFHDSVTAADGEIVGIQEPMPLEDSVDEMYDANAFVASLPEDARNSFIAMAERRGVDVTVE